MRLFFHLWIKRFRYIKTENALAGFAGGGLYPINPQKVIPQIVESSLQIHHGNYDSPSKVLRQPIINAATSSLSERKDMQWLAQPEKGSNPGKGRGNSH